MASCRYCNTSASKVPGCSHTAGNPISLASSSTLRVAPGGVTIESAVSHGAGRAPIWGSAMSGECAEWTEIEGDLGLMGVTWRPRSLYQFRTAPARK